MADLSPKSMKQSIDPLERCAPRVAWVVPKRVDTPKSHSTARADELV